MTTPSPHSASLYVGDLHDDISEALLYEVFREVGPIVSIRVCRDAVTRKSLGYAYVNFQNPQDAERALEALNYTPVKNRPIRIMWSQRDPSIRKSGVGNVFIKNLDKSIDNKALYDTFSAFGNILSCKVSTKPEKITVKKENGEIEEKNSSKGYGFVHFETQEAAEQAIAKVNGMLLNGKKVYVGPFLKRHERLKMNNSENKFTNIYVKNLDKAVTTEELLKMFSAFGKVQHAAVASDEKGASKGFGFVNYENHEDAKKAVDEMNTKEINGKKIYVARHQKRTERQAVIKEKLEKLRQEKLNKYNQGVNLYVKNLDDTFDDEKLKAEFVKFGKIESAKVMKDEKDGTSKGFGFVCFSTPEEANRAITEMNNKMVGTKPLYVALAQRKEDRKAQLEYHYSQRMRIPQGIPAPLGFPPGAPPVFYQQAVPQRGGFVQIVRPRWAQGRPMPQQGPVPAGFVAPPGRGGARGGRRGGAQGQSSGRGRGSAPAGYKYNQNARNTKQEQPQAPVQPEAPAPVVASGNSDQLTLQNLAEFSPEEQKNILGDRLFPLVSDIEHEAASKITGMLLEMDIGDLLHLIDTPEALAAKVQEAVSVLKQHGQGNE